MGITGPAGLNKTQGQQSDRGDPGLKGPQGDPGIRGQKGNDSRKFADDCDCFSRYLFLPYRSRRTFPYYCFYQMAYNLGSLSAHQRNAIQMARADSGPLI